MEKYQSFEQYKKAKMLSLKIISKKIRKLAESRIDEWNRLEEEPELYTRSEVIEHMYKAMTLYGLTGKEPRKSELYSLLSK